MEDKNRKTNAALLIILALFIFIVRGIIYFSNNNEHHPEKSILEEKTDNGEFGKIDNGEFNNVDMDATRKEMSFKDSLNNIPDSIKQSNIKRILSQFRKETDEVTGTEFYYDRTTPKYFSNKIYLYIGKDGSNYYLRFRVEYTAEDWLFIKHIQLRSGDQLINYTTKDDFERDHSGGTIYEWYDVLLGMEEEEVITNIILHKKNILRLIGDQYHHDIYITEKQREAIRSIWHAKNNIYLQ